MAFDRQSIEKRDFPIGRRGYEPDAVDAHLQAVAVEVEQLRRSSSRRTETLATAASEQVRVIVEAAETSAADIAREAEEDARRTRDEAAEDARTTRQEAREQATEHVARVSEATTVMLQRVEAMEAELGALIESLRTGANRVSADLALLQGNMGELRAAASASEPRGATAAAAGDLTVDLDTEPDLVTEEEIDEVAVAELESEPTVRDPAGATAPSQGDDSEGARLIALNMALNGTPREETERYLAENFNLDDLDGLLDEVYSRLGG